MIRLAQPDLGPAEIAAVSDVIRSGMIASGPQVRRFEEAFAAYIGVRHGIAVANGTVALHAALAAIAVGPGDVVVTTPFTFVATANAIVHTGARPEFADIDLNTYNLDPDALENTLARLQRAGTPAKAVLLVHLFGLPCDMDRIEAIAEQYGAVIIEDAAQAHGAAWRGRRVGSFGLASTFSFYATKNLATGEGGMVVTNDEEVARRIRTMINHGRSGHYEHDVLGYNYRLTDMAAAIGLVQLGKLETLNLRRRAHAETLNRALADVADLVLPIEPKGYEHVYHHYTVRHPDRDGLAEALKMHGVGSGVIYPIPLHKQPYYVQLGYGEQTLPAAEEAAARVLSLPVHPGLSEGDVRTVAAAVQAFAAERHQPEERIELVEVDDYTEPAEQPDYYAIYVRLSARPSPAWRRCFEDEWRKVPTGLKRDVTVGDDRLRVEIHGNDMVQEQLDFIAELVRRANGALRRNTPN